MAERMVMRRGPRGRGPARRRHRAPGRPRPPGLPRPTARTTTCASSAATCSPRRWAWSTMTKRVRDQVRALQDDQRRGLRRTRARRERSASARSARKEDARFIRGQGHYVDDVQLPGMLHGAVLRSPARARADRLDRHLGRAAAPEGARGDHRRRPRGARMAWMPTMSADAQAVLATDKVRFQGQEVAFVIADDRYSARDALELIDVEYEPLPVGRRRARARWSPDAPVIRDDDAGRDRQPHLRLGGRRRGGDRGGVRARRRRRRAGDAVPALAPGADGDLRRGRRLRPRRAAS